MRPCSMSAESTTELRVRRGVSLNRFWGNGKVTHRMHGQGTDDMHDDSDLEGWFHKRRRVEADASKPMPTAYNNHGCTFNNLLESNGNRNGDEFKHCKGAEAAVPSLNRPAPHVMRPVTPLPSVPSAVSSQAHLPVPCATPSGPPPAMPGRFDRVPTTPLPNTRSTSSLGLSTVPVTFGSREVGTPLDPDLVSQWLAMMPTNLPSPDRLPPRWMCWDVLVGHHGLAMAAAITLHPDVVTRCSPTAPWDRIPFVQQYFVHPRPSTIAMSRD